jgi:hypothetical protein
MEKLTSLMNKEHRSEFILAILLIIYLVMGFKTPDAVANIVDTLPGKVVIIVVVISLFTYYHPVLAVIAMFAGFDLIRRSSESTGIDSLQKYVPTEEKRTSQFNAFNQFPYTLEQEMVSKMVPMINSGTSITQSSFKPVLDDLHNAGSL